MVDGPSLMDFLPKILAYLWNLVLLIRHTLLGISVVIIRVAKELQQSKKLVILVDPMEVVMNYS